MGAIRIYTVFEAMRLSDFHKRVVKRKRQGSMTGLEAL